MKTIAIIGSFLILAAIYSGCANSINRHTGSRYYDEALQAEARGDYEAARMYASRAYGNAKMGNLGPATEAYSLYELARFSGYTGSHVEAERQFREVLVLIDQAGGRADDLRVPTLAELARLLHDTEQHAKAVPEFQRATAELDEQGMVQEDPIGFADFLTDYARSAHEAGNPELSREVEERARNLRERNRDVRAQSEFKRYR